MRVSAHCVQTLGCNCYCDGCWANPKTPLRAHSTWALPISYKAKVGYMPMVWRWARSSGRARGAVRSGDLERPRNGSSSLTSTPSASWRRPIYEMVSVTLTFTVLLSRVLASRRAFSISRCEVMPTRLTNFRMLVSRASSSMVRSPMVDCCQVMEQRGRVAQHARNRAHLSPCVAQTCKTPAVNAREFAGTA